MILGTIYIVWVADDFLSVFMAFLIILGVPMAGWCGIFLCDLFMRRYPYDERALFGSDGEGAGYGLVRWESVLLLVAATVIGWGLVIDTTGAGKGLDWLGFLLEPLGLGGREGEWAYANLGVPVALVIGFVGYLLLGSRAVRRQEHEQVVAGVRAEQSCAPQRTEPSRGCCPPPRTSLRMRPSHSGVSRWLVRRTRSWLVARCLRVCARPRPTRAGVGTSGRGRRAPAGQPQLGRRGDATGRRLRVHRTARAATSSSTPPPRTCTARRVDVRRRLPARPPHRADAHPRPQPSREAPGAGRGQRMRCRRAAATSPTAAPIRTSSSPTPSTSTRSRTCPLSSRTRRVRARPAHREDPAAVDGLERQGVRRRRPASRRSPTTATRSFELAKRATWSGTTRQRPRLRGTYPLRLE